MTHAPFAVAVELDGGGAHPAAASAFDRVTEPWLEPRRVAEVVARAERFGFTAATFQDAPLGPSARLDAVQRAAFAAPLTSGIGLLPVVSTAYSEPFHVATQLASLDWASSGRAGWIVRADALGDEAAAYGRPPLDDASAAREAADAVEVARRLWDSWQDDAVIRDVATGRYLDADRLHYADFVGETYAVKGPSIVPRPPQGQLVVASDRVADAEIALVSARDEGAVVARAAELRAEGRARVVVELDVVLDARGVSAERRLAALGGWPDGGSAGGGSADGGRLRWAGDAHGLAALVARLAEVSDGVRLHPAVLDVDLEELGRLVLPALRRTIGFRSPVAGATLRETLGLAKPANRFERTAA
ncbi:LLM class flavin-dependent oxidoreductase [Microbacterium gilvum]|uniref:LLM class flavin-dependent oxidoreductase n=1 Tax=Microbacterium gilvum TaxID=1336204 RepID=A0ABP9A4M3_9MICO